MTPKEFFIPYLLKNHFYELAITAWGNAENQPVICVHGLSRQGRDFDELAQNLAKDFYVLCPDLPGRGRSDWLTEAADYNPFTYVTALAHLLAHVARDVYWVGTSLGGICGMMLAAAENAPIKRMVLNDIGPFIPKEALARIKDYLSTARTDFADIEDLADYLKTIHGTFGHLTPQQWHHLALYSARPYESGRIALHYDPAMTTPIKSTEPADTDLWPFWNRIDAKLLTLRGDSSDLLLQDTFEKMGEKSKLHTVANCGHAPALMDEPTITVVADFLRA